MYVHKLFQKFILFNIWLTTILNNSFILNLKFKLSFNNLNFFNKKFKISFKSNSKYLFKVYKPACRFPQFIEGKEVFPSLVTCTVGGIQGTIVLLVAMTIGSHPEVIVVPVPDGFVNCAVVRGECFLKKRSLLKKKQRQSYKINLMR